MRQKYFDYVKGFCIALVVYGHLLRSDYKGGVHIARTFFLFSDSFVYAFEVAPFFILSGFFVSKSFEKRGALSFLKLKLSTLLYPYFIWSAFQIASEILFSKQAQQPVSFMDFARTVYIPWEHFWFLYALMIMFVTYVLIRSVFQKRWLGILIGLSVCFFVSHIMTMVFCLRDFRAYFLFFVFGIVLDQYRLNEKYGLRHYSLEGALILTLVFLIANIGVFCFLIPPQRLMEGTHYFIFFILSLFGSGMIFYWAKLFAERNWFPFIMRMGEQTFPIYLSHMFPVVLVRILLTKVLHFYHPLLHIALGWTAGIVLPMQLAFICEKWHFPYLFRLPFLTSSRSNHSK